MGIDPLAELSGESHAITDVRQTLRRFLERQARARRPASVLLLGETGVGKSLAASLLHRAGPRADGPFVDVNCAAIPAPLLEAELFGFERGAFTDAKQAKPGLVQEAHGGTLFLDEVGLLPEESQAKLLKVLEEGMVRRLGGTRSQPVDAWIIAATSEDLEAASRRRRFRSDLYHRLAVVTVRLPALRERPEDVVLLGERFLREACAEAGLPPKTLTADARAALRDHAWPGNIRELKNVLTRAVLFTETLELSRAALQLPRLASRPPEALPAGSPSGGTGEPEADGEVEAARIGRVLRETGWNVSRAAARLGFTRSSLRYRIDKHGLSPERPSAPTGSPMASGAPPPGPATTPVLPLPVTSLIGRERELREIAQRLATHRVVTLTGTGGVGKTRLALTVGPQLRSLCPDGVWFVELASVGEGGLVAQAVASALGLPEEASRSPLEIVTAALAGRQALLILDNCEHLIGACAALAETLVRACPQLRVLATSRERLDIAGESTFGVPSLALPGEDERAVGPLARSEAVRLFVERARLVAPDFALTDDNAPGVVELCRRLDGLPLAIELAAARVRLLSVEQIVARLNDRFRLLTGGGRTTIARQQTLRAALDWSHDLLSPPERALLRRLSVFTGGFTLEAVEAVCAGPEVEGSQVLDLLAQLVDKSLVIAETAAPVARYRLLETIWEYCREQAIEAGEVARLRGRHRAWFLALAEEAELKFRGAEQLAWLDRLETEYDNLQAALSWRDQDSAGDAQRLRLAAALWRFWEVRGRIREGRGWLEGILAETGREPTAERARALNGAGNLARDLGDYARAADYHAEALEIRREIGDPRDIAGSLNNLGAVAHDRARYAAAEACFADAILAHRQAGDEEGVALSLNNLGRTLRFQGDYDGAAARGRESLDLFRALAHPWGIARALNSLANTAHYQGDVSGARPVYEESLRLRRHVGDRQGIGVSLNSLALLSGLAGDLEAARHLGEEGLVLRRDLGDRRGIGGSLWTLGRLALWGRDLEGAEQLARESLAIRSELDDRLGLACCLEVLAEVAFVQGQHARAARLLGAAAAERQAIGAPQPPLERDRHERVLASLRDHLGEKLVELAWIEAAAEPVVAEELKAAGGHTSGLPRPAVESLNPGAQPDVSSSRPTPRER
ncbi:MAG: sigma 54-interacting transcriptional regulator [Candidatus Rokuibacteriota bacterium]